MKNNKCNKNVINISGEAKLFNLSKHKNPSPTIKKSDI